jgi:hypothetical protein
LIDLIVRETTGREGGRERPQYYRERETTKKESLREEVREERGVEIGSILREAFHCSKIRPACVRQIHLLRENVPSQPTPPPRDMFVF